MSARCAGTVTQAVSARRTSARRCGRPPAAGQVRLGEELRVGRAERVRRGSGVQHMVADADTDPALGGVAGHGEHAVREGCADRRGRPRPDRAGCSARACGAASLSRSLGGHVTSVWPPRGSAPTSPHSRKVPPYPHVGRGTAVVQPAVRGIRFSQVRWKTTSSPSLQTTSLEVMKSCRVAADLGAGLDRRVPASSGRCSRIVQSERVRARQRVVLLDRVRLQRVLGEFEAVRVDAGAAVAGVDLQPPLALGDVADDQPLGARLVERRRGGRRRAAPHCSGSSKGIARVRLACACAYRQFEGAARRVQGEARRRAGLRPDPRPVRGGDGEPDAVARAGRRGRCRSARRSTSSVAPGAHGTARSRPCARRRLSTPRVTRVDEPSGATSQSRAIDLPARRVACRAAAGRAGGPGSPSRSSATAKSKQTERPSSSRWSGRQIGVVAEREEAAGVEPGVLRRAHEDRAAPPERRTSPVHVRARARRRRRPSGRAARRTTWRAGTGVADPGAQQRLVHDAGVRRP